MKLNKVLFISQKEFSLKTKFVIQSQVARFIEKLQEESETPYSELHYMLLISKSLGRENCSQAIKEVFFASGVKKSQLFSIDGEFSEDSQKTIPLIQEKVDVLFLVVNLEKDKESLLSFTKELGNPFIPLNKQTIYFRMSEGNVLSWQDLTKDQ